MLNRLFGRQPEQLPEEPPVDYADLFNQIMEGLATGWSTDQLKACLAGRENDQKFVEWLYGYGQREQIEPAAAERLVRWGKMDCGLVGRMAQDIGERVLNGPVSVAEMSTQQTVSSEKEQQAEALFDRGNKVYMQGDFSGAIAAYDAALAIKPDYHIALYNKGILLTRLGRYEDAIAASDAALAIKPDDHAALYRKGVSLARLGRYEDAIAASDAVLAIKPDDHAALYNKGVSLARLGRYEDAIAAYDAALAIKPDDHAALYNKGLSLDKLGRYEDAIAVYDTASIAATLPTGTTLEQILGDIIQTPNPVNSAKRYLETEQQRPKSHKSDSAWDKFDRLMVMTSGGVVLGTAIARVPGAIIGGLFAAGCWYYISIVKPRSSPKQL